MTSTLPVPSKGALRALRRLALGTSCTIAFATGILTEDRRRRIHSAREIQENARRLKTSRTYHSSGTSIVVAFDEAIHNGDFATWEPLGLPHKSHLKWTNHPANVDSREALEQPQLQLESNVESHVISIDRRQKDLTSYPIKSKPAVQVLQTQMPAQILDHGPTIAESAPSASKIIINNRQQKLAYDVRNTLDQADNVNTVESAIARISDDFANGLRIEILDQMLLDTCIRLSDKCIQHNRIAEFTPILIKILSVGPIDEESFYSLHVPDYIDRLIRDCAVDSGEKVSAVQIELLRDAANLYSMELESKPTLENSQMDKFGEQLCAATFEAKMYELTTKVFWRMKKTRGDIDGKYIEIHILASREQGFHKRVVTDFLDYFMKTQPTQRRFFEIGEAVLNSAIDLGRLKRTEAVIFAATKMAKKTGLVTSVKWHLKLLGEFWRTNKDLPNTQALFDRLKPLLEYSTYPEELYSAIIQFCIEGGNETRARQYLEEFEQSGGHLKLHLRTQGHFALAKAMRNDWEGVKADFSLMDNSRKDFASQQAALFTPILKIFASSHTVSETEEFLRYFCDRLGLRPNQYISNLMIGKYAKSREFDSIPPWIEYVRHLGVTVDSKTFNVLLSCLRNQWLMSFPDLKRISEIVLAADENLVDDETLVILRSTAIKMAPRKTSDNPLLLSRLSSLSPSEKATHHLTLVHSMRLALARNSPAEALEHYHNATRVEEAHLKPEAVALAVSASIRLSHGGDLDATLELIKEARDRGCDTSVALTPLLLHQVNEMDKVADDSDAVKSMVANTMASLTSRGLCLSMTVATNVASLLINRGESGTAIDFLTAVMAENEISKKSINIATLTVCLRAYLELSDCGGIYWVITTLSEYNIVADRRFKAVLRNGRREARRAIERWPDDKEVQRRFDLLEQCFQTINADRAQIYATRRHAVATTLRIMENASITHARDNVPKKSFLEPVSDVSPPSLLNPTVATPGKLEMPMRQSQLPRFEEPYEGFYNEKQIGNIAVDIAVQ